LTWSQDKKVASDQKKEIKDYTKVKEIFITMDMLSFSFDNFPPLAIAPTH